jgi:radical SAM protein with 4Fe4S-binding SPASM domain
MRMNSSTHPRLFKNIYIEEVSKKKSNKKIFFVLDPDMPSWVFVNEDSLELLNLCNATNSVEKISQIIADKYDIEYTDSSKVVSSFLDNMKRDQIIYEKPREESRRNQFRGLALEVTKKCNLRCIHCYLSAGDANDNELTLNEIKELLKSTKDSGGISVALGGGEPLLRDDCIEIIEYAASLDLLISLGTNGTLIDKKLSKLLSELPIKIQVSLDGASKETHDHIRGEGSFELAVRGIDNLINEGMEKDIVIAFVPMKTNVNEIPDIIDFALERQIPVIQFPPLSSSGRAKKRWNELKLSDDEMLWSWEFISKRSEELRGKMDLLADCFSININNPGVPYRCSIGTQFRIDPEGYVYPCQCFHFGSEYCLGNIREKSLENIVYGKRIKEIKEICFQRPLNIDECKKCKWRNFCGSGCMGNAFENSGTILNTESCEVRKRWTENLFEAKLKEISS